MPSEHAPVTSSAAGKRSAELKIDLKAPASAVWKAITDADELTRWFPLEARVKPGVGGHIFTSWGQGTQWESPITIWEPNKHLRVLWCPLETPEPDLFGVDFFIEDLGGGTTRLRLVHFGFGKDAQWDSMYDGVSRGWDFMLWGLQNYLEQHLGTPRNVVFLSAKIGEQSRERAWSQAFSKEGLVADATVSALRPGQRFNTKIGGVDMSGVVRVNIPNKDFQASIDNLSGALLRVQIDQCHSGPGDDLAITLGTFGIEPARIERVRMNLADRMVRMFGPEEAAAPAASSRN